MALSKDIIIDIFDAVKGQPNVFGLGLDQESLIAFINEIWDLRRMPSEDPRYDDAQGDFYQHVINNDDWDIDHIFLKRLKITEDPPKFIALIENILDPRHKLNSDEIIKFVLIIDPYLQKNDLKLALQGYDDNNKPIYKIRPKSDVDLLPAKTIQNAIPFYFHNHSGTRADAGGVHGFPKTTPAFVLTFNSGWNDYSNRTTFYLWFYKTDKTQHWVGEVKIMKNDLELTTIVPTEFTNLPEDFCSMGQSLGYYRKMNELFGKDLESVLYALRDVAFFPKIQEEFDQLNKFKVSLVRGDRIERLLRQVRFEVFDFDLTRLYQFKYEFKPVYAEDAVTINFDFDGTGDVPNRIIALIGKNGSGKTQLITSLPLNISRKEESFFTPATPKFSKVIAISYSIFDRFEIPKATAEFNYVYCGLRNENGQLKSIAEMEQLFIETWGKINMLGRLQRWHQVLRSFLEKDFVNVLTMIPFKNDKGEERQKVNLEGYNGIKSVLSSGQSILLYIISEITANMRLDSLMLYDEPETHLHPNAISQLINAIYKLTEEFQSYCIIATHSPLVIRELPSSSVFVMERFENTPAIRGISIESFGGNLSVLTDDVFGNRSVLKKHEQIVEKLVDANYSYEEILETLKFNDIPVNLGIRLYAKSLLRSNEKF